MFTMTEQRDGNFVMLYAIAMVVVAAYIKDFWIRLFYLWAIVLKLLLWIIFVMKPVKLLLQMNMFSDIAMTAMTAGMIIIACASQIKPEHYNRVFNVFCCFTIFQGYLLYCQYSGLDIMKGYASLREGFKVLDLDFAGSLGNKNFLAACTTITLPMFFRKKWAWFLIGIIPMLYILETTTAFMAAAVAGAYWGIKEKPGYKWFILSVIFACSVVFFVSFDFGDGGERLRWFKAIMATWHGWGWLGSGPGVYPIWSHVEHAHNDYAEVLFDYGIPGGLFVLGFLITFAIRAFKAVHHHTIIIISCLISVALNAAGSYPFHLAPSGFLISVLLGLYIATYTHNNKKNIPATA